MNPYEHLSREERLRRIGELLSKGVTRMLEAEKNAAQKAGEAAVAAKVEEAEGDWITRGIVAYLKRVGPAMPADIRRGIALPKSTLFKRLKLLLAASVLTKTGYHRRVRYTAVPVSNPAAVPAGHPA
ncbi:MAG: hypothetical protein FJ224_07900 [Lentisphaerae bacterium]|nr:hypothetical protein [Lentisphaerota bacterium]